MRVDLDPSLAGIVGQGRRSKVKLKCLKLFFDITVSCLLPCFKVKVKGWGQGQRSLSKVGGQGQMSRSMSGA